MRILLLILITIVLVSCAKSGCNCALNKEWQIEPREIENGI